MRFRLPRLSSKWVWIIVGVLVIGVAWASSESWLPPVRAWIAGDRQTPAAVGEADHAEDHAGHNHDHAGHEESESLELSPQARRNIGLEVGEVGLRSYERAITVPALVVERPGWTKINIAAPLTGVVTGVYVVKGEAARSGTLLFKLRLTHEDLVQSQTEFLRTLGQLDVERREVDRLDRVTSSGAVAGKTLLERQYEKEKLEAGLSAQREALLLHGLSKDDVEVISRERRLIRELEIRVPFLHQDSSLHNEAEAEPDPRSVAQVSSPGAETEPHVTSPQFVVLDVNVRKGAAVQAGEPLAVLADFSELYIEGRAFEQDAEELVRAANAGRTVSALLEDDGSGSEPIDGLEISHVANEVETDSRALHFYVRLPNTIVRDAVRSDGRRFLTWKFKAGQRMQVQVPVEMWQNAIVLPVEAVAQEGPEAFVFMENGDHFDRRPVHVQFRDQRNAVIANDGSVFPGDTIALNAAHQLQMALKNKAGGGVDPHAGHNH